MIEEGSFGIIIGNTVCRNRDCACVWERDIVLSFKRQIVGSHDEGKEF